MGVALVELDIGLKEEGTGLQSKTDLVIIKTVRGSHVLFELKTVSL